MRIQPRQQLLDVWRAVARSSYPDRAWTWGGRDQRNSISDAEQLLCLVAPATEIETFKLDIPDETAADVTEALHDLGDSVEIPRLLIRVIVDYLRTYTDENQTPVFGGGSYFTSTVSAEPTLGQRAFDVVDSFAASVRLTLATIGFARVFRNKVTRAELRRDIEELERLASRRLTAAMVGLLRSFAINVFEVDSPLGQNLCRTVNQSGLPVRRVVEDLQRELRQINAGLRDLKLGQVPVDPVDLDNPNRLFECGWSWGIIRDAPEVPVSIEIGRQPAGVAEQAPYLYFTVVALDSIQDLFSERTRILALLDEEQQRLSAALQQRWDLTQTYWSKIARFGRGRWPLEDLPWRTTDELESDYLSLLVSSIVVQDLTKRRAAEVDENDYRRVGEVLAELAARARITRRPRKDHDEAVQLHAPGFRIPLEGSDSAGGEKLSWVLSDFSPQLLKRTLKVAGLLTDARMRRPLITLAEDVWVHLLARRMRSGSELKLWDQPGELYPEIPKHDGLASWYYTERVVECMIAAAGFIRDASMRSPVLSDFVVELLAEADHLFDQELLNVSAEAGPAMGTALQTVRATLRRAQELVGERPGTAASLAQEVLRELDRLAAARQNVRAAG
jgi:hypothetical protein